MAKQSQPQVSGPITTTQTEDVNENIKSIRYSAELHNKYAPKWENYGNTIAILE